MAIKYTIFRHRLRNHRTGYSARVVSSGTVNYDELVEMVAKNHTTITKADTLGTLENYEQLIVDLVREGKTVVTRHAIYQPVIQGDFDGVDDRFDWSRHEIGVRVRAGKRWRRALTDIHVVKVDVDQPQPSPKDFWDLTTGQHCGVLTPGGQGKLQGHNLRFAEEDPQQGVFFVDQDRRATRVESLTLNDPSLLIFAIPALVPGQYVLEVRCTIRGGEVVRAGRLHEELRVE